jgi:hypothetical protein
MSTVWANEAVSPLHTHLLQNDESPAVQGFHPMGAAGFEPATSRV